MTPLNNDEIRYISRVLWNVGYRSPMDERDITEFEKLWKTDRKSVIKVESALYDKEQELYG